MPEGPNVNRDDFEREAQEKRVSLPREFLYFLTHNKKWWLLPVVIVLLLAAALIILGATGAAPFLYTLY